MITPRLRVASHSIFRICCVRLSSVSCTVPGPAELLHSGGGAVRVRHEPGVHQDQGRADPHQVPGAPGHALRVRQQRGAAGAPGGRALRGECGGVVWGGGAGPCDDLLPAAGVAHLAVAAAGRRAVRVQLAGAAAPAEAAARARRGGAPGGRGARAGALRRPARPGAAGRHRRLQRLHLGSRRQGMREAAISKTNILATLDN